MASYCKWAARSLFRQSNPYNGESVSPWNILLVDMIANQNCTHQTPDFPNFYYIIMALEEETKQVKAGGPIPIPVRANFCFT